MATDNSLAQRLERNPIKVNKWNAQEIKVTLEDLIARYFVEEANYEEDHGIIHWRLFSVISMTIIGSLTSLYAYITPFQESKLWVLVGAITYLVLMGTYTFSFQFLVKPTCFRGSSTRRGRVIWVESDVLIPSGELQLNLVDPKSGKSREEKMKVSIGDFIMENGVISGEHFCKVMKKFVNSPAFSLKQD